MKNNNMKTKIKKIKAGDIVQFRGRIFDVVSYNGGVFKDKKGKLKLMEQKSMFNGGIDFFYDEMSDFEKSKIIINPKQ